MAFGLQDSMDFGGTAESFDSNGNDGIVSALENIGVNAAAGAASVGLSYLGKSAGVQSAYSPYNSALLTQNPSLLARGPYASAGSNSIVLVGFLLIGGLLLFAAFRRKG